jgi:predicted Zn-dependent peptidase
MRRAMTKTRAALYDLAGSSTRFGLLDLLACFALFDDDPARVNRIESELAKVTPELVSEVARRYLTPARRTLQAVEPGAAAGARP